MMTENTISFEIICDYKELLVEAIQFYNDTYKTDFTLTEYIEDEVNFANIEGRRIAIADVYSLGTVYGRMSERKERELRES